MAKMQNLSVDTIKIKNGALTQFYLGTTSVTVPVAPPNPVELFVRAAGSPVTVSRSRGGVVFGSMNGQMARMFIDPSPAIGDTYSISGDTSGAPKISAVVRLR